MKAKQTKEIKPSMGLIERFITMLAFSNQAYPSDNIKVNEYWGIIRDKHTNDCLKYGKCEICGEEDLLGEYGLNWVCDDPECLRVIKDYYDGILYKK